jgi:hypothetical protein
MLKTSSVTRREEKIKQLKYKIIPQGSDTYFRMYDASAVRYNW